MKDWFKKLYTRFFAWVARIPHDKLLHFAFGATLTAILAMFPLSLPETLDSYLWFSYPSSRKELTTSLTARALATCTTCSPLVLELC